MRINNNLMAMNAHRQLGVNSASQAKSLEKLSSGFRVNRAGDDAAGLAISEKMRGQIRGLNQASRNAQDTISLIQTAEGALTETHNILQRMRELAVQSVNDTNTDADRDELQAEVKQLKAEVNRIATTTEFNTKKLLDGSAKGLSEQILGSAKLAYNTTVTMKDGFTTAAQILTTGKLNESYTLVRVASTSDSTAFQVADYKIYDQAGAAVATIDSNTTSLGVNSVAQLIVGTNVISTATIYSASAGFTTMVVGESITFTFGKAEAAGTDVDNAILTQIGANSGQSAYISVRSMKTDDIGVTSIDVSSKFGAVNAIETVNQAITKVSTQRSSLGANQNRLEYTIRNLDTASENLQASESRIRDVDMAKEMMTYTKSNILNQAAQAMLAQANQAPQGVLQLLR